MVAFSRSNSKVIAIDVKKRVARHKAHANHPDMKLKHPDWCRDAAKGDYTMLNKKIKEDCLKEQARNEKFRSTLHAK